MNEYLKYWPIMVSIVTIAVSFITQWSIQGTRIATLEDRQNRQGTAITAMQLQVTGLANDVSGMKATIDAINSNVNYIRNRIDRVTQ